MSKQLKLIIVLLFSMFLAACDVDPYKGKRPIDYPNTTWNCNQGLLTFSVTDHNETANGVLDTKYGEINVNLMWSILNADVTLYNADGDKERLFSGTNDYGKDRFTMEVKDTNGILSESSITFSCIKEESIS